MTRAVFLLALVTIMASASSTESGRTLAYFTSSALAAGNTMSVVNLNVSTSPSVSGVFNVAANMVPGDFQLQTLNVVNAGAVTVAQQDFTYSFASTSLGAGNTCSLLDSSDPPTCSSP